MKVLSGIRKLLIVALAGAFILINSGCSTCREYFNDIVDKTEEQVRRREQERHYEDSYFLAELQRRQIGRWPPSDYRSEEERDWFGDFGGDVLKEGAEQFIDENPELNNLQNLAERLRRYEVRVEGEREYERGDVPEELAYEDLREEQELEEVSAIKVKTRKAERSRTRAGIKVGSNPELYFKADNPRILGVRVDKIRFGIDSGGIEVRVEEILGYPDGDKDYWYFTGGLGLDHDNSSPDFNVSVVRSGKGLNRSRFAVFGGYGNIVDIGNSGDEDDDVREGFFGARYVLSF